MYYKKESFNGEEKDYYIKRSFVLTKKLWRANEGKRKVSEDDIG